MTAFAVLLWREVLGFVRRPSRVVATLGTPALVWVFLASGFAGAQTPGGESFGVYAAPGVALLVAVFGGLLAGMGLIQDRRDGFLAGVLASPAPRWSIAGAKVAAATLLAAAQGLLILLAIPLAGGSLTVGGVALASGALLFASAGVCGLSLAAASRIESPQGFHGVMNLLIMPMWLLSGALTPLDDAHPVFRALAAANPLRWGHEAMLGALRIDNAGALAWVVAAAFAGLGIGAAMLAIGRPARGRAKARR
ncbi:MAG: ABC transporter permease [Planctomycetota bacterium]